MYYTPPAWANLAYNYKGDPVFVISTYGPNRFLYVKHELGRWWRFSAPRTEITFPS